MSTPQSSIQRFLAHGPFAVVGASTDRSKVGNQVLRAYLQNGLSVYPINPKAPEVEGLRAYPSLTVLPERVQGISVITPPAVTEKVVEEAHACGVTRVWMQAGAESEAAIMKAESYGMEVIAGGPCILVSLHFRDV